MIIPTNQGYWECIGKMTGILYHVASSYEEAVEFWNVGFWKLMDGF